MSKSLYSALLIPALILSLLFVYYLFFSSEGIPDYQYKYTALARTPEEAIHKFQCNRCHAIPSPVKPLAYFDSCIGCHQMILSDGFEGRYRDDAIRQWKNNIRHVVYAPSLEHLSNRVSRSWFRQYLQSPHVVRPHLKTMMPRLIIKKEEVKLLVDYFFKEAIVENHEVNTDSSSGDTNAGEAIYNSHGCTECHAFGQALAISSTHRFGDEGEAFINKRNAPDLQFVRDRMTATQLVRFLQDPIGAGAPLMPDFSFSDEEARQLAAFLMHAELPSPASCSGKPTLELLKRDVFFDEVNKAVFASGCRHCHSEASLNRNDGGPGNTGGFGYPGKRLDLSTYSGILRGATAPDGKVYSVIKENNKGVPLMVSHLLARRDEICGKDTGILGMPLALPPLSDKEIQLVWTWIAQGARKDPDT